MALTMEMLADRVGAAMEAAWMSQRALGQAIGFDPPTMSKALSGKRGFKPLELALISETLGISVQQLLADDGATTTREAVLARVQPEGSPATTRWPTPIVQYGVAQLPWSLVATLLDSCPDRATSEFYAQRAVAEGWTRSVLQTAIASRLHERTQPALTTFDHAVPESDRAAVRHIVKDPFILDFLAADPVRERDLSKALTDNLTRFLRELGTGFAFVGAEVPVPCGDREFFVDLLFYHCRLHRYVVFELKLGRFEPEDVGKLNFYVQLVDDHLRDQVRDDPTLGMLLVVGRDDVTVEVALRGVSTPLAVTE